MDFMFQRAMMMRAPTRFEFSYNCYSMAILGRSNIDEGDKIILPPSALDILAQMNVEYPLLFSLTNARCGKVSHCGVLEFSAEEGRCYMPFWMMQNLLMAEGQIIDVKNISLSKASFVKLKPQNVEFLEVSNPRALLEVGLRKFTCLTVGDTIRIPYSNRFFHFKVLEVKPNGAASIVETDCEVDFDEPEGYKESEYYKKEVQAKEKAQLLQSSAGSAVSNGALPTTLRPVQKAKQEDENDSNSKAAFQPFVGAARRIDGKAMPGATVTTTTAAAVSRPASSNGSTVLNSSSGQTITGNKIVSSQSASNSSSTTAAPSAPQFHSRIGDKFSKVKASTSAFTGSANKLK